MTGSVLDQTTVTGNGMTIVGAENLAATVPPVASNAYSRNISALLLGGVGLLYRHGYFTQSPYSPSRHINYF